MTEEYVDDGTERLYDEAKELRILDKVFTEYGVRPAQTPMSKTEIVPVRSRLEEEMLELMAHSDPTLDLKGIIT